MSHLFADSNAGVRLDTASRRVDLCWMLLGALPGLLLAVWLYGPALDPRHVEWLLAEGDSLQHFSGWDMFRRDDWRWPLGALPTLGEQVGASIVFSDSLPLLALPLKLLHTWLPDPFQYIGPLMLFNLMLNGAVATGLLRWCGVSRAGAFLAAVMVVSLPMVTMRGPGALGHEALSSHWILLMAVWLWLFPVTQPRVYLWWLALLVVAVLIHFYLFFMVGVMWAALCFWEIWKSPTRQQRWRSVCWGALSVVSVSVVMWLVGYFEFELKVSGDSGFGLYSTELLSLINPGSAGLFFQDAAFQGASALWRGWQSPVTGQYEGFAYLGAGAIGLLVAAIASRIVYPAAFSPREVGLLIPCVALFLFALSHHVVVGVSIILLPHPEWLSPLTQLVRSSGRLVWPLAYVLLLGAIVWLDRQLPRRKCLALLTGCVLLQVWDVSAWQRYVHHQVGQLAPGQNIERPYAWRDDLPVVNMLKAAEEIRLLPGDDWHQVKVISWLAARYDLVSNVAYYARTNPGVLYAAATPQREALAAGEVEPKVLYALTDEMLVSNVCQLDDVNCHAVEGMTFVIKQGEK